MIHPILSRSELDLLGKYDTPTVYNVIELFNVRTPTCGYMDGRIRSCFPELPPMVGYASTATFRAAAHADRDAYATLDRHIGAFDEIPSPPILVFQDLDDPSVGATFGELMCMAYKRFGAVGLITSGPGRDLQQVHALSFPVFTSGTVCAHGYCHIPSIHVPVRVGGLAVRPGDLLHGDCNGVTTIPAEIASEAAHVCADYMLAEAVIVEYLRSKRVSVKGLAAAHAECGRMIDMLAKRVSSGTKTQRRRK